MTVFRCIALGCGLGVQKFETKKNRPDGRFFYSSVYWCRRRDSNSHSSRHYPLKIACLPIPPRRLYHTKLFCRAANLLVCNLRHSKERYSSMNFARHFNHLL